MLTRPELRLLTSWCQSHAMRWHPMPTPNALLLEPAWARHPWQRMVLTLEAGNYHLAEERGPTLACASDFPALLDALDGGIADSPALAMAG